MTNDLTQIKKKYLKQKKRERLRREKEIGEVIFSWSNSDLLDESLVFPN